MAEMHTLVIEYEDGKAPTYGAGDLVHGGRLVAVDFDGNRLEVAETMFKALQATIDFIEGKEDAIEPFGLVRSAISKFTGK